MEVSVTEAHGFDSDAILSIRVGSIRRQGPIWTQKPFTFPASLSQNSSPCRVDVYRPVGSSSVELAFGGGCRSSADMSSEAYPLRFPTPPGSQPKAIVLNVKNGAPGSKAGADAMAENWFATTSVCAEADADTSRLGEDDLQTPGAYASRAYLNAFRILDLLQELLGKLLRERPSDPVSFLTAEFQKVRDQRKAQSLDAMGKRGSDTGSLNQRSGDVQNNSRETQSTAVKEIIAASTESELTRQNDLLSADILRLQGDVVTLKAFCSRQGVQEQKWEPLDLKGIFFKNMEDQGALNDGHELLAQRNRALRMEHDQLRNTLTSLALGFAKFVRDENAHSSNDTNAGEHVWTHRASQAHPRQSQAKIPAESKVWWASKLAVDTYSPAVADADEDESDEELVEEPPEHLSRKRANGVSAEAYGAWNNRHAAFVPPFEEKEDSQQAGLLSAFHACPLFAHIDNEIISMAVAAMPVMKVEPSKHILRQGEYGDSLYVILSGAVECYDESVTPRKFMCKFHRGRIFGELAMLYNTPRKLSVCCAPDAASTVAMLSRSVYQNLIVRHQMKVRERWEECLCRSRFLETLNREQIANLVDILELREYEQGEEIVRQGADGDEFFIVMSGTCSATVATGTGLDGQIDVQEHRRYVEGELFGERAIVKRTVRAATVTAVSERVELLCLTRDRFARVLGPLEMLQEQHYKTDPRKSISDFYSYGNEKGSRGVCRLLDKRFDETNVPEEKRSRWFAVYRPTSRDAIAKMLSGHAVGKGLNIKGKSARRGRQSGYVPFLQISNNDDKKKLGTVAKDARIRIFYASEVDRLKMLKVFEPLLDPREGVDIVGDRLIDYIDTYLDSDCFGLEVPEPVLWKIYIERADLSFQMGWETGRKSEPAFMDMVLTGLRSCAEPKTVLYQSDLENPLNPHGLLLAYAERLVKPVVSDFDTFMVGSRGMTYTDLAEEQVQIEAWAIEQTVRILENPGPGSWTSRWLDVLKKSKAEGFRPHVPKYGFGDPTSYYLVNAVIDATCDTGAVRHGAECFNYLFPQELDDEYLVVWDGFLGASWEYLAEDDLRDFLIQRANEGYVFPLNPVWLIRDVDWYEVYQALLEQPEGQTMLDHYFPVNSGLRERIQSVHERFPDCFLPYGQASQDGIPRKSLALDMDASERVALALGRQDVFSPENDDEHPHDLYVPDSSMHDGSLVVPESAMKPAADSSSKRRNRAKSVVNFAIDL